MIHVSGRSTLFKTFERPFSRLSRQKELSSLDVLKNQAFFAEFKPFQPFSRLSRGLTARWEEHRQAARWEEHRQAVRARVRTAMPRGRRGRTTGVRAWGRVELRRKAEKRECRLCVAGTGELK